MTEFIPLINLPYGTAVDITFLTLQEPNPTEDHEARTRVILPIFMVARPVPSAPIYWLLGRHISDDHVSKRGISISKYMP
ncbi:MAG: hypothetical protein ABJI96_18815 [Paracoccaceae bacterium]